jgi:beta-glucosidase
VVLSNGSAVTMPWVSRVPAVVEGWLAGQAGGAAVADILLGRVNPSGKLSETFAVKLSDTPAYLDFPATGRRARYAEGLFTGYRWYDAREIEPLFAFGHGLSYTTFAYTGLAMDKDRFKDTETLTVSLTVKNSGGRAGQEVVQLYVRDKTAGPRRPYKELRAFAKVALRPGEEQELRFQLAERDFAYYDEDCRTWATRSGEFEILLAASSRDIRLQHSVFLESTRGRPRLFDSYTTIREWLEHPVGRERLQPLLAAQMNLFAGGAELDPAAARMLEGFILDMPVVKLVVRGAMSREAMEHMIAAANW